MFVLMNSWRALKNIDHGDPVLNVSNKSSSLVSLYIDNPDLLLNNQVISELLAYSHVFIDFMGGKHCPLNEPQK